MLTMRNWTSCAMCNIPRTSNSTNAGIALLQDFSKQSEENARVAKEMLFGLQNSQKAITGYQSGLLDKSIMDSKAADEAKQRAAFKADPKNAGAPDSWEEIAQAMKLQRDIYPQLAYLERLRALVGTCRKSLGPWCV